MLKMRITAVSVLVLLGAICTSAYSETTALFELSLEELMNVEVSGTLTERNPQRAPVSVTVITAEDIALTPARNLLDLIEIYVPGAFWLNHSSSPQIGMRGIIADRNYKYLINVNGRNVNTRLVYGAVAELTLWELSDIEKVEIIRGPGSVIYGPGAIAGVINITTKRAKTSPGTEAGALYWNKYHARGGHLSHGRQAPDNQPDIYGYVSVVDVLGLRPDHFTVGNGNGPIIAGYLEGTATSPRPNPPATYFGDFHNEAQVKAFVDVDFKNGWRFWTRYTSADLPQSHESLTKLRFIRGDDSSPWVHVRQRRLRQFIATVENKQQLNEDFELKSTASFSSQDLRWFGNDLRVNGDMLTGQTLPEHSVWASENNIFAKFQLNYDSHDQWKAALGMEFNYNIIGPAWGKNRHDGFRIGSWISSPESDAYYSGGGETPNGYLNALTANFMGHGWKSQSHGIFGEVNIELADRWSTLLSARIDKHTYTDYMFSPRAALIHDLGGDNWLKFVVQRSVRMNAEEELFRSGRRGLENKPEKLDTYEIMYSGWLNEATSIKLAGFYNDNEVIAWNNVGSGLLGRLKTAGLEFETLYTADKWTLGANHAFVKQLDWENAEGRTFSGISYSDYTRGTLTGYGNNLNNVPNHITKFFSRIKLDDKFTLHGDMRIFWGWEGGKDGLRVVENSPSTDKDSLAVIRAHDAYEVQATGGLSLTYHVTPNADLSVYAHNIPIYGDNKRYGYSSGHFGTYANKTTWIEEPVSVGVRFVARF